MRRDRRRAVLLFALAGALAAALHVIAETGGALRDWRQTLPLATAVGAVAGGVAPLAGSRAKGALAGALVALGGLAAFALLFAAGHGAIEAVRGGPGPFGATAAALGRTLALFAGPTGAAAVLLAAGAGALSARGR